MINCLTNLRIETSHIPVSLFLLSAQLYVIVSQPARDRYYWIDERIKNYLKEIKYEGSHTNWLNFRLISVTLVKNVTEQGPYPALKYLTLNFQ